MSRYADVTQALRDTATYSSAGFRAVLGPGWLRHSPLVDSLLLMDPPDHSLNRALVSRAFMADVLAQLEPVMEEVCAAQLDDPKVRQGEEVDIVDQLANPLAGSVIAEALGLPRSVASRLAYWTSNIAKITPVEPAPEVVAEITAAIDEQERYLGEAIDARMANPGKDLPSVLCQAEVDGERLSRADLIAFMFLLVGAGFETTIHLISKSMLLFAQQPEILAALRAEPSLVGNFVEEMLRFDPPIHMLMRLTTREVEVHGTTIPPYGLVGLMLGAANRDPDKYDNPDTFDLTRKVSGGLGFGLGPHVCVGAALARMEAKVCIRAFIERYSAVEVNEGPRDWNYALHVRGLNTLPVRLIAG